MKNRKYIVISLIIVIAIVIVYNSNIKATKLEYQIITANEAYNIIESEEDFIILDVRTESEYASGHIKGSILLPYDEISIKAETVLPNKNKKILIYCRSGNRSSIAAKELSELGYTDIIDFGGIISWNYELVK